MDVTCPCRAFSVYGGRPAHLGIGFGVEWGIDRLRRVPMGTTDVRIPPTPVPVRIGNDPKGRRRRITIGYTVSPPVIGSHAGYIPPPLL
eukprot:4702517-Pyramimonas_sp.AAC.1